MVALLLVAAPSRSSYPSITILLCGEQGAHRCPAKPLGEKVHGCPLLRCAKARQHLMLPAHVTHKLLRPHLL